jgi:glycine cleavage system transcriptional repressor
MEKIVVAVLGRDRPGIVAAVTRVLFDRQCNIEDVSQTILQGEFAGVFLAALPEGLEVRELADELTAELQPRGLSVMTRAADPAAPGGAAPESEPFVVTTKGPDRPGLVAGVTEVMAHYNVNITNLRAVFRGGDRPDENVMIYEVDIPVNLDRASFVTALRSRATELELDLSLQHRDIFEAVSRI